MNFSTVSWKWLLFTRRTANANANLTSSACLSAHTNQCSDGLSAGAYWVATAERGRSTAGPAVLLPVPPPRVKPLSTNTVLGRVRPRSPAFRTSTTNELWRSAGEVEEGWPVGGVGWGGSTAAQITSDINPQNKVGRDPNGEKRGTSAWPRKAEPSALVNFIHAFIPSHHWETRVKGHQKLVLKPKV